MRHNKWEPIACLAIVGSRSLDPKVPVRSQQAKKNARRAFRLLDKIHRNRGIESVVSGGAGGPDTWAERWAEKNKVPCWVIKADWDKHGKSAGFIRNVDIIDACTRTLAFWDGVSRGTNHSISLARKKSKPLKIVQMPTA